MNDHDHQHLIDLANKVETIEDKIDRALRVLGRIAKGQGDIMSVLMSLAEKAGMDDATMRALRSEVQETTAELAKVVADNQP